MFKIKIYRMSKKKMTLQSEDLLNLSKSSNSNSDLKVGSGDLDEIQRQRY